MGAIVLRSSVPGPLSQALQERRHRAVPRGLQQAAPVYAARAEGALVEDVDGNVLSDLAGCFLPFSAKWTVSCTPARR
jgi:4-aminobutyrate aminotransferase / (S)-3-amino-2-methylpropionate transaminase / 5-aminovalerate transaminase